MRRVFASFLVVTLVPTVSAQFDQFAWTLEGNPDGSGFVTPDVIHVSGPDGGSCEQGTTTWFETVAPCAATVSAFVSYIGPDGWPTLGAFDSPAWVIDGVTFQPKTAGVWWSGTYPIEFEVLAGQTFGFGIWSGDCCCVPGVGDFYKPRFTPHEWLAIGEPIDPQPGPMVLGTTADRLGDVTGDGRADFVTGVSYMDSEFVWSGADGAIIFEVHDESGPDKSVVGVGDMDGDGTSDWVAGVPQTFKFFGTGAVHAWRGSDGSELFVVKGESDQHLGSAVAGLGDVDADGLPDIAVRSAKSGEQVRILGGVDGHLIATLGSIAPGQAYGSALAGTGDVDLDGVPDVLVGIPLNVSTENGLAHVYSGSSWTLLHEVVGSSEGFGKDVSAAGDLDHDGTPDLLVSEDTFEVAGLVLGAVTAYSGASGAELFRTEGVVESPLGEGVAGGSDVTGDDEMDFLTVTSTSPPSLQVRRGTRGDIEVQFAAASSASAGDVAVLGNVDDEGPEDVALIADGVQVFKALDGLGKPSLEGVGDIAGNEPVQLVLGNGLPGGSALLLLGSKGAQTPLLGGVLQPEVDAAVALLVGAEGSVRIQGRWPPGLPQFTSIWSQAWIMDPAGPQGWTCTNGLIATQVGD